MWNLARSLPMTDAGQLRLALRAVAQAMRNDSDWRAVSERDHIATALEHAERVLTVVHLSATS
ncbi:MAG: hypothetical protein C5B58_08275 [Acidobacteria bacterium]|nr:MAG: hypothetical protein C5B58_08275 [Acidobacteriota bacterium]